MSCETEEEASINGNLTLSIGRNFSRGKPQKLISRPPLGLRCGDTGGIDRWQEASPAESAPHHLVRTLGDASGPFVGSWTCEISPVDTGSEIVLTEVAEFKNPLLRVMTRIFGQTKYMDEHLEDLAKKPGETATMM